VKKGVEEAPTSEPPAEEPKKGETRPEVTAPEATPAEPQKKEKKSEVAAPAMPLREEKLPEVVTPEAPAEEKKIKKMEKLVTMEGGFAYRNIVLHQGSYAFVTQFDGEMVNNSGINYSIVKFIFSTFDGRGKLLTEEAFHITDFNAGETKPFKGTAVSYEGSSGFKETASFKIRLKSGVAAAR
jgi:hypothetical protein